MQPTRSKTPLLEQREGSRPNSSLTSAYYYEPDRLVSVAATREYFGALPAEWVLTLPDLLGTEGFEPGWTLQSSDFAWEVVMAELTPGLLFGEPARSGEVGVFGAAGLQPPRTIVGRLPSIMW